MFTFPNPSRRFSGMLLVCCVVLLTAASVPAHADDLARERDTMQGMLDQVCGEVEKRFYDPNLRGLEWKALKEQTRQKIAQAQSPSEMITAIFVLINRLDDSHTIFIPPQRIEEPLFGFEAQPYGNEVRVSEVKKGGAAEAAGLKPGDRIVGLNNFNADRASWDLMMLYYRALSPVGGLQLQIVRGKEPQRTIDLAAKIKRRAKIVDMTNFHNIWDLLREWESDREVAHYKLYDDGIGYLELPTFLPDPTDLRGLVKEVENAKAVIVDLRGNLGGRLDTLKTFTGFFEPQPTTMAQQVGRKKSEPIEIRPRKPTLAGPMFILVDSHTASAGEMFARHFQRTGRAKVIGDRTAGRVTASRVYPLQIGLAERAILFAVQVGTDRVVYPGGEELEKRGVTPDIPCLPTAEEMAANRDACLAQARALARKAVGLPDPASSSEKRD